MTSLIRINPLRDHRHRSTAFGWKAGNVRLYSLLLREMHSIVPNSLRSNCVPWHICSLGMFTHVILMYRTVQDVHTTGANRSVSEHWVPGLVNAGASSVYEKGDAVDIYVDSAKFLPDSCTASRIVVRALTSDGELVGEVSECPAAFSNTCTSPIFNMRMELREKVFNMTLTLLLRIDTLETSNLNPVCVGYTALKLFRDSDNAQPIESGAQVGAGAQLLCVQI